ncbi:MAG: PAS domain S-box protein [bacterium]
MGKDVLKVLYVDDDEDDYIIIRDLLSDVHGFRYEVEWAAAYDAALEAMGRNHHDIYLFDYRLGERNGLELLREAVAGGCKVPVILLTGQGDHEVDMEAMEAGASDFLVKGRIETPLLERSIRYAIDRKRIEQKLRVQRDMAQQYLDVAGVMLAALDPNQNVTLINKKGCQILGHEENEILGKNWFDHFVPERTRNQARALFKKLMEREAEPAEKYESPVLTKTGEERTIAWNNTILKDEAGRIIGMLRSGEDVTLRVQAEAMLKQKHEEMLKKHGELIETSRQIEIAKNEWEETFNCVKEIIILADHEGKIRKCNKPLTDITGKTYDALQNKNWKEVLTGHEFSVSKFIGHGMELLHKPTNKWFLLKYYPFRRVNGDGTGTVIIIQETTEIRQSAMEPDKQTA